MRTDVDHRFTTQGRVPFRVAVVVATLATGAMADDYTEWLETHFPEAIGIPALEASVWGEQADPDGDRCVNLVEFVMNRDPMEKDPQLGLRVRVEGGDLVATYRETTLTDHQFTWLSWWSTDLEQWLGQGIRYEIVESHPDYRLIEARVAMNREEKIFIRLAAVRSSSG